MKAAPPLEPDMEPGLASDGEPAGEPEDSLAEIRRIVQKLKEEAHALKAVKELATFLEGVTLMLEVEPAPRDIAQATIKHASQDLRIQDFGVMSGILHSPGWNESLCDFALAGLQLVIRKDVIQESLEPRSHPDPLIDTAMAAHATEQAWEQIAFGSCPKFLIQKTFEMGTSEVRFYEWWSMLQEAWLKASLDISRQLKEIFHAHDENKDGDLEVGGVSP